MKKILGLLAIVVVTVAIGLGLASAHVGTKPNLTCTQVSADFTSFPSGSHNVTFVVDVDGTTTNVSSSFTGTSGTASADISSLTTATGELSLSAYATWTDDGGGQTEKQEVKLTCHDKVTPPVTPPATAEVPKTVAPAPVPEAPLPTPIEGK